MRVRAAKRARIQRGNLPSAVMRSADSIGSTPMQKLCTDAGIAPSECLARQNCWSRMVNENGRRVTPDFDQEQTAAIKCLSARRAKTHAASAPVAMRRCKAAHAPAMDRRQPLVRTGSV